MRLQPLFVSLALAAPFALLPTASLLAAPAAAARQADTAPVLVTAAHWQQMASEGRRYPWFAKEQARTEATLKKMMKAGIDVPVPRDKGGGRTHEQHKRNYQALLAAGTLYRLTGDRAYVDYARDMLLQYAQLYPTLGPHPEGRGQIPGRVFWQVLNDSVWLVNAIQGYDAIRDALSAEDRDTIESKVFRPMAEFLVSEPKNYDQIHNHATWAVAATGMTGYVLRDQELVEKSLRGSQKDDKFGFLRQIDLLFSPDGYYEEGPYYQRYALAPFLLFANAIERNEPQRKIFARRDGVLLKAVDVLVQSSYGGLFFPINDAILDKGIDTEELVAGIGIAYARTGDDRLLSVAQQQKRLLLSPEGLQVAQALAANKAKPFDYRPMLLRDGPDGDRGGLAILRMNGERGQALVQKDTMQGMGHGHFDKLNWLFYDNGNPVVTDYGAARFLNVEAKRGGISWPRTAVGPSRPWPTTPWWWTSRATSTATGSVARRMPRRCASSRPTPIPRLPRQRCAMPIPAWRSPAPRRCCATPTGPAGGAGPAAGARRQGRALRPAAALQRPHRHHRLRGRALPQPAPGAGQGQRLPAPVAGCTQQTRQRAAVAGVAAGRALLHLPLRQQRAGAGAAGGKRRERSGIQPAP